MVRFVEVIENYFIIDYSQHRFKAKCRICEKIFIAKKFDDLVFMLLLDHLVEEHNIRIEQKIV